MERPEELNGKAKEIALIIKNWSKEEADRWWDGSGREKGNCDRCNGFLKKHEGFLLGNRMRCEEHINSSLCDAKWEWLLSGSDEMEIVKRLIGHFGNLPVSQIKTILKAS